jgi:hypothetical protein
LIGGLGLGPAQMSRSSLPPDEHTEADADNVLDKTASKTPVARTAARNLIVDILRSPLVRSATLLRS